MWCFKLFIYILEEVLEKQIHSLLRCGVFASVRAIQNWVEIRDGTGFQNVIKHWLD